MGDPLRVLSVDAEGAQVSSRVQPALTAMVTLRRPGAVPS
jgi:hypothetical protein